MSEDPDSTPPSIPLRKRRPINWHRVRVYFFSTCLVVAIWVLAAVISIRENPKHFIESILNQSPIPVSIQAVDWLDSNTLQLTNIKVADFFYADSIIIKATPWQLICQHLALVRINGGQLFTKPLYEMIDKSTGQLNLSGYQSVQQQVKSRMKDFGYLILNNSNWTIARLEIYRATVLLDNPTIDTAIPIRLGTHRAVILTDLRLGKPDSSPAMNVERRAEIENVMIVSPFDPVSKVLSFPLIRVRYTYAEIWQHQLREVQLIRPTMYLGEDLFWFADEFKKERKELPEKGLTAPWAVSKFSIMYGQLAVSAFGQPVARLPFFFDTEVDNIRLDQLNKISAKSTIAIQRLDQDYPDYKVRLEGLTGRLYFSLPLSDTKANNVVNTIHVDKLYWNEIPVENADSTVTFDPDGVYGKITGTCEGGQMTGNFEFYYSKGFTWNADLFADNINCEPIAAKLGGKYINLTGHLNGKVSVQGQTTEILNCSGLLSLPHPGVLDIKSFDSLLKDLPPHATSIKDQLTKIAVENFRQYPYESGQFKVDYKPEGGSGSLMLNSKYGKREFDIFWHPSESSNVAKAGDNQ